MIRLVVSLFILMFLIFFIDLFPIFIPHVQYAGFFFMKKGLLSYSDSFIITYAELIILLLIFIKIKGKLRDRYSKYLFLLPLSSIPALTVSFFIGNFYASLYLFFLLLLAVYYYEFILIKMKYYQKIKIVDLMVLSLLVAGVFNKLYQGFVYGPVLAPYMNSLLYGLISRGGGVNASNHIGGIIVMLLPLIVNKKVFVFAVLFLILCFSRGIYFILFVYLSYLYIYPILKKLKIKKSSILSLLLFFLGLYIVLNLIPSNYSHELLRNFIDRIKAFLVIGHNERLSIFNIAFQMFEKVSYIGVGPANFYYGYDLLEHFYHNKYSNAHNIYLTLLVENGIIFLTIFIFISLTFMYKAYHIDKRLFASLSIFMFYGLFSGQLYEAGMGKISLYDYYYYLFILAFIRYKEIIKNKEKLLI